MHKDGVDCIDNGQKPQYCPVNRCSEISFGYLDGKFQWYCRKYLFVMNVGK